MAPGPLWGGYSGWYDFVFLEGTGNAGACVGTQLQRPSKEHKEPNAALRTQANTNRSSSCNQVCEQVLALLELRTERGSLPRELTPLPAKPCNSILHLKSNKSSRVTCRLPCLEEQLLVLLEGETNFWDTPRFFSSLIMQSWSLGLSAAKMP